MRARSLHRFVALVTVACGAFASQARADPGREEKAAARALAVQGMDAASNGDCLTAVDLLARAEALVHAPTIAEPLAECEIQLGHLVAGVEILQRLSREILGPGASPPFVAAMRRVAPLLAATVPRLSKLRIHVEQAAAIPVDAVVTLDQKVVPRELLDTDVAVDPGPHKVLVMKPGFVAATAEVDLTEAETRAVSLTLEGARVATPPASSSAPTPASTPSVIPSASPTEELDAPNRTPAIVVLGVGAAGLAVGAVFGALALSNKSALDASCPNAACPASLGPEIDRMHTNAIVSTIGFGAGALALAVGGYLLFAGAPAGSPTVRPTVGLGSLGLTGSF